MVYQSQRVAWLFWKLVALLHHWARSLNALGIEVKLLPQHTWGLR